MSRILIINASPRRDGNISQLLSAIHKEAEQSGCEVETVYVADADIRPCHGCMACRSSGHCSLPEDDAQRILSKIRECDILIIGSPTYWSNMPGTLKNLFDRTVYGFIGDTDKRLIPIPLLNGKRAVIVATCTTPYPINILFRQSSGTIKAIRSILKMAGIKTVATMQRGGTGNNPINDGDLNKARRIIHRVLN